MKNITKEIAGDNRRGAAIKNRAAGFFLAVAALSGNAYATADALRIKIAKGTYSDETVIRFIAGATADFDGSYDAWKLFSFNPSVPNLFTKSSAGDELAINTMPAFVSSITMEAFLKISTAGTYTISAEELEMFSGGVKIILKDLVSNQLYDLRTSNTYTINLPVIAETAPARFQVFFSYPAATQISNATCSHCLDGAVTVTKAGETNWQYLVKDTAGKNVAAGTASAFTHNIDSLASGNYTVAISGKFSYTENRTFSIKITPILLGATFIEFTAIAEEGIVNLFWSTGMESNTSYFTVEHSEDGINYKGIENVAAAGNSSILRTYSASDNQPYKANSYYRIKLTDLNGDISYSKIVTAMAKNTSIFSVFPNPACEMLNLTIDDNKNSEVSILVRDLMGREVMNMKTVPTSDHASIAVAIPSMIMPGIYVITAIGMRHTAEQIIIIN